MGFISVFYRVLESHNIEDLTEEKAQEYYECSLDEIKYLLKKNKRYIKARITRPKTVVDIDKLKLWAEENEYTGKLNMIRINIWCRKNEIKYKPDIKLFYKPTGESNESDEWVFPTDFYSTNIFDYYLTY